jgi:hypothetical protein
VSKNPKQKQKKIVWWRHPFSLHRFKYLVLVLLETKKDRLYGTLDEKIQQWMLSQAMLTGCCGTSKDSVAEKDLFKERMLVAYDLTVALAHMHSLR